MPTDHRDFAKEWVEAWNSHELGRVLSHYDDAVTLISPRARLFLALRMARCGRALRDCIKRALEKVPDLLHT
jgi:hypothetical protein